MLHWRYFRPSLILIVFALALGFVPVANAKPLADGFGFLPGCTGEYFNNVSLTGSPSVVRSDPALNFFWAENTSPAPGINTNNYSVRWTCSVYVATAGNYSFTILTDDGMNLLLDGNLLIWAFYDQGPTSYSATTAVSAGWHTVKVEYYNRWNAGTAQVLTNMPLTFTTPPPTTFPDWKGEYYNNQTLSGAPTIVRNDAAVNFNWGTGSPDPAIPVDHFSARWSRTVSLASGTYRFTTVTDDGVRLWVDGTLVIDRWMDQAPTSYQVDVVLAAGAHGVIMEYYENAGGALAQMNYAPISPTPSSGVWHGQYFNNIALSGAPTLVRDDALLNFNWFEGSPGPGIPIDNFSVKWDSVQTVPTTGNYQVTATSDDGVRVWVDGALVIDAWYDHAPTTFVATRYMTAGAHAVHVEYYDHTLGAMINVQIGSGSPPPPPPPTTEVVVDDRGPGWQAGGIGGWRDAAMGINGHAFYTLNNTYTAYGYNWARWFPTLPAAGYYEVLVFLPNNLGTTLNARYWVYHGGRYDLAARAQGFYTNQWLSLGTYYFSATGGEYVSLADVTYECYLCRSVAFDAVKFVPR
jgi:hypothetical protein